MFAVVVPVVPSVIKINASARLNKARHVHSVPGRCNMHCIGRRPSNILHCIGRRPSNIPPNLHRLGSRPLCAARTPSSSLSGNPLAKQQSPSRAGRFSTSTGARCRLRRLPDLARSGPQRLPSLPAAPNAETQESIQNPPSGC